MVDFNENNQDLIYLILDRASDLITELNITSLQMDIMASNGVNRNSFLDLEILLDFDDFNFLHDIYGFINNMNRETGKLENNFLPRCAR